MKVIDLLNKIANGEQPIFKFRGCIWKYNGNFYKNEIGDYLDEYCNITTLLNCEVEIIEEDKKEEKKIPEKLSTWFSLETPHSKEINRVYANTNFENMYEKINEIIDCLDYLKKQRR